MVAQSTRLLSTLPSTASLQGDHLTVDVEGLAPPGAGFAVVDGGPLLTAMVVTKSGAAMVVESSGATLGLPDSLTAAHALSPRKVLAMSAASDRLRRKGLGTSALFQE